ncbi:substrate-binding domain-containing protein [Halobacillus litoralis]|uniref:substrate-binding domain-containing protein n=1 Tax=Halobacillus litoralis TaxID=45668 RepID=UPI001CD67000|nr:substrate-binding domain-containing protein [Halobacillus litoralis]MCA0969000.1 substrate-binding domain-containing protein [Halobacillus litoralis]
MKEAETLMKQYDGMLQRTSRLQQGYQSSLSIAMSPLLVDSIFPSILRKYTEDERNTELSITVAESSDMQQLIEDSEVDVALSCTPSNSKHIQTTLLSEESITLVTAHDGWDSESGPVVEALELLSTHVIFTDHHPTMWPTLKRQVKMHAKASRFAKVSQSYAAKRFILEGMGVSFLPFFAVSREIQEGRMITVETPFMELPKIDLYALHPIHEAKSEVFVEFVKGYL